MKLLIFTTLTLGLAATFHSASATTLHCPSVIKINESLQENVNGWNEFLDKWNNVHNFNRVSFYTGHPNGHASLVPDNEGTKSNKGIWTFGKDKIWVACGYSNTTIQLTQKLRDETKTCTVTYSSNIPQAINCI